MRFNKGKSKYQILFIISIWLISFFPGVASAHNTADLSTPNEILTINRLSTDSNTAIAVSQEGWPDGAKTVILSRDDDFPDILAGGPLAYKHDAPILLTPTNSLPPHIEKEIDRLKPETVYILGGTGAVTQSVEDTLTSKGLSVIRIQGENRFDTAAKVAENLGSTNGKAVIAYGDNYPDAMSISAWAAQNNVPILLTQNNNVPAATSEALKALGISESIVVGGSAVVSDPIMAQFPGAKRYSGPNRYATSTAINNHLSRNLSYIYIASGNNFSDALVGAVLAAKNQGTLALVDKTLSEDCTKDFFRDNKGKIKHLRILGTPASVPESAVNTIEKWISLNVTHDAYADAISSDSTFYLCHEADSKSTWVFAIVSQEKKIGSQIISEKHIDYTYPINGSKIAKKIYMPFGAGVYNISVYETPGDKSGIYAQVADFKITNTDPRIFQYLFPSSDIESDDEKIVKLALEITDELTEDLEKAKAVHDWVATHIAYDTKSLLDNETNYGSALDTLQEGSATCIGYSRLTAALLRAVGLKAKVVTGYALGYMETWDDVHKLSINHVWNEVYIDDQWIIIDTTWDAGSIDDNKQFIFQLSDQYFNPDPAAFAKDHRKHYDEEY